MALFNYATKEITLKIVYYGPGLSGKTTNLQFLHSVLNPETKGKLLSLSTESDRTLFFDFLPIELGKIRDFSIRFQLYTVPGQVRYNATRKVVLKGADAIVFVADSQREMKDQNVESFSNMRDNLLANNINPDEIAVVLQYNKRDLKNILSVDDLNRDLNHDNYNVTEATAVNGAGVEDTFKLVTKLLLKYISKKHKIEIQPSQGKEEAPREIAPSTPEEVPIAETELPEAILMESGEIPLEQVAPEYAGTVEIVGEHRAEEPETACQPLSVPAPEPPAPRVEKTAVVPAMAAYEAFAQEIKDSREAIVRLEGKADRMSEAISLLQGELKEMRQAIQVLSENIRASGEKGTKDTKQEQGEILKLLKGVASSLEGLKEKKSWFRF